MGEYIQSVFVKIFFRKDILYIKMVHPAIENHFSSLIAIGFLFGTAVHGKLEDSLLGEKMSSRMGYDTEQTMKLFGYKKVGFTRCNETFCTEAHIGDTLQQIRKGCDDNSWCTMIYHSHCK